MIVLAGVYTVQAMPIEVGEGDHAAGAYIEWKDGFSLEFVLNFAEESISGVELIRRIAQETALTAVVEDHGFGEYVDNIAWGDHSDGGYLGGEDWWHYWIKDAGQDWVSPQTFGASGRVVVDGVSDGWVYGRAGIPEPATLMLIGAGMVFVRRRRG